MKRFGFIEQSQRLLAEAGMSSEVFAGVEPIHLFRLSRKRHR